MTLSSYVNRIGCNSATTGTSDLVLDATAINGYRDRSNLTNGATYNYSIRNSSGAVWEDGQGVWNSGTNTLTRATILDSSAGGTTKATLAGASFVTVGNLLAADLSQANVQTLIGLDTDGTMAANSDTKIPSQKAVVTYVGAHGGVPVGTQNNTNAQAHGTGSIANGVQATGVGYLANATGDYSTAVGTSAATNGSGGTALGASAFANGIDNTAIGANSTVSGNTGVAIGKSAVSAGSGGTAIGPSANAAVGAIAVGYQTIANGASAIAVGVSGAIAHGDYSVALGYAANAWHNNSVAIGDGAVTTGVNQIVLGVAGRTTIMLGGFKAGSYTVATLPTGADGLRTFVTDALTPVGFATVTGGGAVHVPVYYESVGPSWKVG